MPDQAKLAELHQRLDHGCAVIDAERDQSRRERLINFWLKLLDSYERLAGP